jgi:hypothetical protein
MKQAQDITEHLKEENALEWIGEMNNMRACVRKRTRKLFSHHIK